MGKLIESQFPSWTRGDSKHHVPVPTLSANGATSAVIEKIGLVYEGGEKEGQKSYKGEDFVPVWGHPVYGEYIMDQLPNFRPGMGNIFEVPGVGVIEVRHPRWWKPSHCPFNLELSEEERAEINSKIAAGEVPEYAISLTKIAVRSVNVDRELSNFGNDVELGTVGNEVEYVGVMEVADEDGNVEIVPVDIQALINHLEGSEVAASIEGFSSQIEQAYPHRKQGESMVEYQSRIAKNAWLLKQICNRLGIKLLPLGVIPGNGVGQPNFGNPHVRNVLVRGMSAALGRDLSVEDAANMLAGFGTNGLHINVGLQRLKQSSKKDSSSFVGDERAYEVAKLTNPKIKALMKVFTLNGNLVDAETLASGALSVREQKRKNLATARVGEFGRYSECYEGFEIGVAPSVQRAMMGKVEEGKYYPASTVHNPAGRIKPDIMETTIFDAEPNLEKITWVESLLNLYVTSVDKALLRDPHDPLHITNLVNALTESEREFFVGMVTDQENWDELVELIDTYGTDTKIFWDGEYTSVSRILLTFIGWVLGLADCQGIEGIAEDIENIKKLQHSLTCSADTFEQYFDVLEGEKDNKQQNRFGCGNVAMVSRNMFKNHILEGNSEQEAYVKVVNAYNKAWDIYLDQFYACTNILEA